MNARSGAGLGDGPLFEAAFDHAPVGMALLDLNGQWFRINPELCRMLGYPVDVLLANSPADLVLPEDAAAEAAACAELSTAAGQLTAESRYRHRDGNVVWVRRNMSVVRDAAGEPSYVVAAYTDIGARRTEDARLAYLALHDALTGLANRALLDDRMAQAVAARDRDGGVVTVLFCDVDGLKTVNDSYGHRFGDDVLVTVATRLAAKVRGGDTVARVGGDEFVVVAHLRDPADAEAMCRRLRSAVEAAPGLLAPDGRTVDIRVSIGYAVSHDDQIDASTLLGFADESMYAVKRRRLTPRRE
ncbi:MAG: diguanylate cyclase domain-containing protein [Sporichthyaceae bacterium]